MRSQSLTFCRWRSAVSLQETGGGIEILLQTGSAEKCVCAHPRHEEMCEQAIRERVVSITGKQVEVVTTNMFVWHTAMTDDSGPSYTLCVQHCVYSLCAQCCCQFHQLVFHQWNKLQLHLTAV